MIPSPLHSEGDFEELRQQSNDRSRLTRQMMQESTKRGAEEYIRLTAPDVFQKQVELMKLTLQSFNDLTGSTLRFSVPTMDAMIAAIGLIPSKCGMQIVNMPAYKELHMMFQAMKRKLQLDTEEAIKKGSQIKFGS